MEVDIKRRRPKPERPEPMESMTLKTNDGSVIFEVNRRTKGLPFVKFPINSAHLSATAIREMAKFLTIAANEIEGFDQW